MKISPMKISRIYDAQVLDPVFFQSLDLFIFGTVTEEERNQRVSELWGDKPKPPSYHLDYDLETEEYSLISTPLGSIPSKEQLQKNKRDITAYLRSHLLEIGARNKSILIDITGISQPAIFFILKLFYEDIPPARLFFAYTEPLRYRAKYLPPSEDVFELTERFVGLKALPGFIRRPAGKEKRIVALLIGFEGKRPKYVCNTLDTKSDDIRVILGFPGFRPGWQYLAYGSNQSMFEHFQAHRFLSLAAANNPFEAYNSLEDIRQNQIKQRIDSELIVAPVGTKPHSVAAAIFALHNSKTTRLVYDFPVKAKRYRTEGYGTTWIYNLSELMNANNIEQSPAQNHSQTNRRQ